MNSFTPRVRSIAKWASLLLGTVAYLLVEADTDFDYAWDHSVYPPFTDLDGKMHNWNHRAFISSYSFIRLTNDESGESGHLFSQEPFQASDWFVDFQFEIASRGNFHGDGMAFWYTEKAYQVGEAFGHDENFVGLGVFFDTYRNGDHSHSFPYIGAMVGDGFKRYHHENDGMGTLVGGCHAAIVNTEHPVRAKVIYASNTLEVVLDLENGQGWTTCLKAPKVVLPKKGYIGFTAATGAAHSRHDILSVTTARIPRSKADRFLKSQLFASTEKKSSFILFFFFIAIVAAVGYYYHLANQKKRRF